MRPVSAFFLVTLQFVGATYTILSRLDLNAPIYLASDEEEHQVVLKCADKSDEAALQKEYDIMHELRNEVWSVTPIEFFHRSGEEVCIAMEELGLNLNKRNGRSQGWTPAAFASIAIGIIDALKKMHLVHDIAHRDLHAGNVATRDDSQLVILDYGDATLGATNGLRTDDIQNIMGYLGMMKSSSRGSAEDIKWRKLVDSAKLSPLRNASDYDNLRGLFNSFLEELGFTYEGKIIWNYVGEVGNHQLQ